MATGNELESDLRQQVEIAVRSGYGTESAVLARLEELVRREFGKAPAAERLLAYARDLLDAQLKEEARWTEPTTNDAISWAFQKLYDQGIAAAQNVGGTLSEAWARVLDAVRGDYVPARGATFFLEQDVAQGVLGAGLMLSFGALSDEGTRDDDDEASLVIAREVFETLERHGVAVEWDRSVRSRIRILPFPWRNRRWSTLPSRSSSMDDEPQSLAEEPSHRQILEQLVRDEGVAWDAATAALEAFICSAARERYGVRRHLEAKYNPELGLVEVFQCIKVVEARAAGAEGENQRTLAELRRLGMEVEAGDELVFQLIYLEKDADEALLQDAQWGAVLNVKTHDHGIEGLTPHSLREGALEHLRTSPPPMDRQE
ncbi:DUF6891 domain-containing protein [Archangium violaceum]|uniref:DUF6891 domain-containing protein n=1 Tax=Archangium violaceum TaxID=83451 RepID=UPI0036D9361D